MNWWIDQIKFSIAMAIIVTAALLLVIPVSLQSFLSAVTGIFVYRVATHFLMKLVKKHEIK